MTPPEPGGPNHFTNPVAGVAVGDPFVLRHRGRFYLYGTNDGPPLPEGRVVPVFRSDDLIHWVALGGALVPGEPGLDHWAPEVLAWNGRFYMVVSFGDVDRRGHELWVAVADRPEGPFRLRTRVSDPSERFSIDGSWLLDDDGHLYLFRCLDFVAEGDPPYGTGIVVQPMRDPLTPDGTPRTVLRAHAPWHLFEPDRLMPLYGGVRFPAWTTIEGPAPVKRDGRYYCGYSGGNYAGEYGTGEAVADAPLGPYHDLRGREGPLFGTTPNLVEGPGHFSVVSTDLVHDWIVLHGRVPGEPLRRVWLCPASWDQDGVQVGRLTDRPQPPPPMPTDLSRFAQPTGSSPDGWRTESSHWRIVGDGLRHDPDHEGGDATAWRDGVVLTGDWSAEVFLRFPDVGAGSRAGVEIGSGLARLHVVVSAANGGEVVAAEGDSPSVSRPLPILGGDPFDLAAFHAVEIRARGGRADVRIDGVLLVAGVAVPSEPAEFGLYAGGPAIFDAVSITLTNR